MPNDLDDLQLNDLVLMLDANKCIYLRYKNKSHTEEATKNDGERYKNKTGILLAPNNKYNGGRYQTQNDHIINAHPNVTGVVDLLNF